MARYAAILAAAMAAAALTTAEAQAQARVEVGVLTCTVRGGTGFIVGSTKDLRCRFNRPGRDEFYHGTISKFGLDIGATKQTAIAWAVLAPTARLRPGSLNGTYGGVSAEATVGLGRRAPTRSSAAPTRTSSSSRSACRRSRASTSPPASPRCSCARTTDALQGPRRFASGARPHAPLAGRPPDRPSLADKRRGVRGVSPRPGCRAGALLA